MLLEGAIAYLVSRGSSDDGHWACNGFTGSAARRRGLPGVGLVFNPIAWRQTDHVRRSYGVSRAWLTSLPRLANWMRKESETWNCCDRGLPSIKSPLLNKACSPLEA